MSEELKYQNINEIKVDSKLVSNIAFKPLYPPIIVSIVGIAMLFLNAQDWAWLSGYKNFICF